MNRKNFLKTATVMSGGLLIFTDLFAKNTSPVYGHNGFTYRMDNKWSKLEPAKYPVKDCHEMIQDSKGRIVLLTNETSNNILVYDKSGKLITTWGHEFPGGHGLTLQQAGGEDYLFITDTEKHEVYKTTIDGKLLMTIDYPEQISAYTKKELFVPTETTVLDNGEFYIADGYGLQYVMHYDANGKLLSWFGGRGEEDKNLDNAHGILVDRRKDAQELLVTDRTRNCFKRFSLDGQLQEVIHLPGACVCRPVIDGNHLYAAVLRSPDLNNERSGFVTILDKDNKVISNIGGTMPEYENGKLKPMAQAEKIFVHPHDVCVDDDGNLYVAQWNSDKVYPYKFIRV
jgi:peptidylamidoglycolate lyase